MVGLNVGRDLGAKAGREGEWGKIDLIRVAVGGFAAAEEEGDFLVAGSAKYRYVFGNRGTVALRLQMH